MEPLYVLFVSAGGVFLFFLFAYILVRIETAKKNMETKRRIFKSYSDKNLAKMEYDFAFYNGDLYSRDSVDDLVKQVTIDDVLSGEADSRQEEDELSRFNPIEEVKENVVVGHYNPESVND